MNTTFGKFVKAFFTSGIAAVIVALSVGVSIHSLEDLKGLAILVVTSFIMGGVHALAHVWFPVAQ